MKVKVTADSTCDLSPELLARYDVTLAPLTVIKDGQAFADGVTITPRDIFMHVAAGGSLCSTAAVSVGEYQALFSRYAGSCDGLVHITIGGEFSTCYQNACLAAAEFPYVRVVDSRNLSTGHGHVVLRAAELAESGMSAEDIVKDLNVFTSKVDASFILSRLDYMKKGGRCSSVTALGANLLKLHPCIEVIDGKMSVVKKYRGSIEKVVADYLRDRLEGRTDLDTSRAFLVDTCPDDHLASIAREILRQDGRFDEIIEAKAGCTIFCHCGPGTLGVVFLRKS